MGWPGSIGVGILTAATATIAAGWVANLSVGWYRISSRDSLRERTSPLHGVIPNPPQGVRDPAGRTWSSDSCDFSLLPTPFSL